MTLTRRNITRDIEALREEVAEIDASAAHLEAERLRLYRERWRREFDEIYRRHINAARPSGPNDSPSYGNNSAGRR